MTHGIIFGFNSDRWCLRHALPSCGRSQATWIVNSSELWRFGTHSTVRLNLKRGGGFRWSGWHVTNWTVVGPLASFISLAVMCALVPCVPRRTRQSRRTLQSCECSIDAIEFSRYVHSPCISLLVNPQLDRGPPHAVAGRGGYFTIFHHAGRCGLV